VKNTCKKLFLLIWLALLGLQPVVGLNPKLLLKTVGQGALVGVPIAVGGTLALNTYKSFQDLNKEKAAIASAKKQRLKNLFKAFKIGCKNTFCQSCFCTARKALIATTSATAILMLRDCQQKKAPTPPPPVAVARPKPTAVRQFDGVNRSRLFSAGGELRAFFNPFGALDVCKYLYGIPEAALKAMSLAQRIKFFDQTKVDGEPFWKLAGVDAAELAALRSIATTTRIPPPTDFDFKERSCFRIYSPKQLASDALAKPAFDPASLGAAPQCQLWVGKSIQALMAERPDQFQDAVVQSASRFSSFEGGADALGKGWISDYQPHAVQGETFATQMAHASFYRKYLLELILATQHPAWYGKGVKLVNRTGNWTFIGIQRPSRVAFVSEASKPDDDRPDKRSPALAKASTPIHCSQITSFAMDLNPKRRGAATPEQEEHAKAVLKTQMLGAVQAAFLNGHQRVFLTGLGLGSFMNHPSWFGEALQHALVFAKTKNMQVCVIIYDPNADKQLAKYTTSGSLLDVCEKAARGSGIGSQTYDQTRL
jgi:hypothetical protein